jgi:predicted transcriptional regulator with HTH domain
VFRGIYHIYIDIPQRFYLSHIARVFKKEMFALLGQQEGFGNAWRSISSGCSNRTSQRRKVHTAGISLCKLVCQMQGVEQTLALRHRIERSFLFRIAHSPIAL